MSAHNCARIYNTSLSPVDAFRRNNPLAFNMNSTTLESEWPYSLEMTGDLAMNGFLLYSLLLDKAEHQACLELPHDCPTQRDRLAFVLAERNKLMEGIGQEEWNHACDLCFVVRQAEDGQFGM